MLNVFINEEFGYQHWWWEYPGTVDDLIMDWNSHNAPFFRAVSNIDPESGKTVWTEQQFRGTLTQLPVVRNDPYGPALAGTTNSYIVHLPNDGIETRKPVVMDDFFHAFIFVEDENSYLRIGKEILIPPGELTHEENEIAENFSWLEHSEDPTWYRRWAERQRRNNSCNSEENAEKVRKLFNGQLSPRVHWEVRSHIAVCQSCRKVLKELGG